MAHARDRQEATEQEMAKRRATGPRERAAASTVPLRTRSSEPCPRHSSRSTAGVTSERLDPSDLGHMRWAQAVQERDDLRRRERYNRERREREKLQPRHASKPITAADRQRWEERGCNSRRKMEPWQQELLGAASGWCCANPYGRCPAKSRYRAECWLPRHRNWRLVRVEGGPHLLGHETYAFEIDHIIPWCVSQDSSIENLQVLCPTCHTMKTRKEKAKGVY